jgi:hypothetical protein
MKIAFLIAFDTSPFAGVIKAFLEWAKIHGKDAVVITHNCSSLVEGHIKNLGEQYGFDVVASHDFSSLVNNLKPKNVEKIISDDYVPRLKLLFQISRRIGTKSVVYCQVLYGLHSITRGHYEALPLWLRSAYLVSSFIPFKILTYKYRNLLLQADTVIADTKFISTLLNMFYGVSPAGIVYTPINDKIFTLSNTAIEKDGVLIYLGSEAGDTSVELVQKLVDAVTSKSCKVHLFGNESVYDKIEKPANNVVYHKKIPDEELSKLYSSVNLTIAPQIIEFYGLVPVESLSCGTRVLTRYAHEVISDGLIGDTASSDKDMLEKATRLSFEAIDENAILRCHKTATDFASMATYKNLIKIIK